MNTTQTNSKLPVKNLYASYWSTFLSTLNAQTELNFRIPKLSEWQYAYKGGNKSQSYTYSGSNIISNVAWYNGNSNGTTHPVKQLQPNELGFYDMSGNVFEYVTEGYLSYYGGGYDSTETNCLIDSYTSYDSYSGLRIALSNN